MATSGRRNARSVRDSKCKLETSSCFMLLLTLILHLLTVMPLLLVSLSAAIYADGAMLPDLNYSSK